MRRAFWIVCSLVIGAIIVYLSIVPVVRFTGGTDKLAHAASYAAWTAVTMMIVRYWITSSLVLILALAAGVGIEFVQPYFDRVYDTWDMVANVVGMILGALFAIYVMRPVERWFLSFFTKTGSEEV